MVDFYKEIDFTEEIDKYVRKEVEEQIKEQDLEKLFEQDKSEQEKYKKNLTKKIEEEFRTQLKKACIKIYQQNQNNINRPVLDIEYQNELIVCNLPKVDQNRKEALKKVLFDRILDEKFHVLKYLKYEKWCIDSNNYTTGQLFLQFRNEIDPETQYPVAKKVAMSLNGFKLDQNHELQTYYLDEVNNLLKTSDVLVTPNIMDPKEQFRAILQNFQKDEFFYQIDDRLYLKQLTILDNIPTNPLEAYGGSEFVQLSSNKSRVEWSRNGTYLIEYLDEGFWLYTGPKLEKLNFYAHPKVQNIIFSPNEEYVLSYNGDQYSSESTQNFIVWNTISLEKIRTWKADKYDTINSFSWNYDGKYLAQVCDHKVCVYEMPQCQYVLNNEKQIREPIFIPNVQNICWNSRNNLLCCASYEGDLRKIDCELDPTKISKISFYEIPSFTEIKWKSINIQVNQMDLYASDKGTWFSSVLRCKLGKKTTTQIQVANLKKRDVVEVVSEEFNEKVKGVQFDLQNGRFAVLVQTQKKNKEKEANTSTQLMVKFYQIAEEVTENNKNSINIKLIGQQEDLTSNNLQWAKSGNFFTISNKEPGPNNGNIVFGAFVKQGNNQQHHIQTRNIKYPYLTDVHWDDSGRYFMTTSIIKGENQLQPSSYKVYDAKSELVCQDSFSNVHFQNIQFRPKYKIILETKEEQKILENMREITKKYEKLDYDFLHKAEAEARNKKEEMKNQFISYLTQKRQQWIDSAAERIKIRGFDEDRIDKADLVEILIDQDEQIISEQIIKQQQE